MRAVLQLSLRPEVRFPRDAIGPVDCTFVAADRPGARPLVPMARFALLPPGSSLRYRGDGERLLLELALTQPFDSRAAPMACFFVWHRPEVAGLVERLRRLPVTVLGAGAAKAIAPAVRPPWHDFVATVASAVVGDARAPSLAAALPPLPDAETGVPWCSAFWLPVECFAAMSALAGVRAIALAFDWGAGAAAAARQLNAAIVPQAIVAGECVPRAVRLPTMELRDGGLRWPDDPLVASPLTVVAASPVDDRSLLLSPNVTGPFCGQCELRPAADRPDVRILRIRNAVWPRGRPARALVVDAASPQQRGRITCAAPHPSIEGVDEVALPSHHGADQAVIVARGQDLLTALERTGLGGAGCVDRDGVTARRIVRDDGDRGLQLIVPWYMDRPEALDVAATRARIERDLAWRTGLPCCVALVEVPRPPVTATEAPPRSAAHMRLRSLVVSALVDQLDDQEAAILLALAPELARASTSPARAARVLADVLGLPVTVEEFAPGGSEAPAGGERPMRGRLAHGDGSRLGRGMILGGVAGDASASLRVCVGPLTVAALDRARRGGWCTANGVSATSKARWLGDCVLPLGARVEWLFVVARAGRTGFVLGRSRLGSRLPAPIATAEAGS